MVESNHGNRIRKTVSFKEKIYKAIEKERGGKPFSTFVNEFLEDNLLKGGKNK